MKKILSVCLIGLSFAMFQIFSIASPAHAQTSVTSSNSLGGIVANDYVPAVGGIMETGDVGGIMISNETQTVNNNAVGKSKTTVALTTNSRRTSQVQLAHTGKSTVINSIIATWLIASGLTIFGVGRLLAQSKA